MDAHSLPVCDGLSFATTGERVVVLGAPGIVFAAATGLASITRGSLEVRGRAPADAVRAALVAGAAHEPPLPPKWKLGEYVAWSARLAGATSPARRAAEAIAELKLDALATTPLGKLVPHARRAAVVASALATGAETLLLEDPLGGLPDDLATAFAELLVGALASRSWLVFAPRMPLGLALAGAADEAIVVGNGMRVDAQGAPRALAADARRFVGRIDGAPDKVAGAVAEAGGSVEAHGASHVVLELGPTLTTAGFFAICAAADVAVLELVPAVHAFA